jgi:hypothetical protein
VSVFLSRSGDRRRPVTARSALRQRSVQPTSKGSSAEPPALLGFIDSGTRHAVQQSVDGAKRRLANPECQRVFSDYGFGVPATADLATVRFFDDSNGPPCARGSTLAFTQRGGRVVHVCGTQFKRRVQSDREGAEIIVIHELLHVLGLAENPPTSDAITTQVAARCGDRVLHEPRTRKAGAEGPQQSGVDQPILRVWCRPCRSSL